MFPMTTNLSRNQLAVVCLETKLNSRGGEKAVSESPIQKRKRIEMGSPN